MVRGSHLPLYRALMDELTEEIAAGRWKNRQRMPTESDLCAEYGVSTITVRRALSELVRQGLIYRIQGKGTYVTPLADKAAPIETLHEHFAQVPGGHVHIGTGVGEVAGELAALLGVGLQERVLSILRLKVENAVVTNYERAHVPISRLPRSWRRRDFEGDEYFLAVFTRHGLRPERSRLSITASIADETEREQLKLEAGEPVLRVQRIALSGAGAPLWVVEHSMRAYPFSYEIEIGVPPVDAV